MNGFSHLTLTAFRGFRDFTLEIEARSLVFTGPNGGGKTNLLEAISFLSPGSGLRSAALRDGIVRCATWVNSWMASSADQSA